MRGTYSYYYWGYGFVKYNPFDTAFVYANGKNNINLSTNGGYNFSGTTRKMDERYYFQLRKIP